MSRLSDVPKGRSYKLGPRGGYYYLTTMKQQSLAHKKKQNLGGGGQSSGQEEEQEHSAPDVPDIPHAEKMVKVSGKGVGVVAGIVDGKLIAKHTKNEATAAYIKKVIAAGGDEEHPGQFLAAMKKIGKDMDLNVSA